MLEPVRPDGWPRPSGYSDGIAAPANARQVYVSGQIAWDEKHRLVGGRDFAAQFKQALHNVVTVVRKAGGGPEHLASMTIYVTDKSAYDAAREANGAAWREVMGKRFPAIALVEVKGLLEPGALVEIQAIAAIPPGTPPGAPQADLRLTSEF